MTIDMPEGLRWLAWVAGTTWPEGDEDLTWAVSEAWTTASRELEALLADIDAAKQATIDAYPHGEGGAAMGARYDSLRSGDQSIEALAKFMGTVGDSTFDMGTEIQATKITVIVTLAWLAIEILWAWLFPPTAPAVEAAAITTTRSFLKVFEDFVQKAITNLAARLGASTAKRHFWTQAARLRPVFPTAKGWGVYGVRAVEATAIVGTINGSVQVGQLAAGKRRHFNGKEFGLSVLAGVAGVIPGREFGRYLGKGIDKVAGKQLDNVAGRVGRGIVIGGASGAVGTAFGNLAVGAATGDFSSFSSGAGWVGGISRGAMVGGARGGFALGKPIPPGHGDIRSYVWMSKPKPGDAAPPPPGSDGSSSGSSSRSSDRSIIGSDAPGSLSVRPVHSTVAGSSSRSGSWRSSDSDSGSTVFYDAVSSIQSGGSGSSMRSGSSSGSGSTVFYESRTDQPPTSWSSSVDGGWTPPPPSRPGSSLGGPPIPPPSSSSSGHSGGSGGSSAGTNGNPIANHHEPFLGEGKDVRGKPRPKQWPWVEPLPGPYSPPSSSGSSGEQWLVPPGTAPAAGVVSAEPGRQVDVPFSL
ncbi:hypothetical protein IU449_00925 [Nocardia higoensis]|uniref:Outer membrane channel protein CpnT-like N-terminal domain-containing protein n=1 Tax=Nocardia higoensis TaxID=228599 RepID=A0ABS0D3R3_9NOCA|nr:hypothetical protein [Nocardia higoensis]MBF6353124.1 hypothetical protein [Nocardia higoensis]